MTASGEAGCSALVYGRWATVLNFAAFLVSSVLGLLLLVLLVLSLGLLRLGLWE